MRVAQAQQPGLFAPPEPALLTAYDQLEAGLPFVEAPEYATLVNFKKNSRHPIHNWYYFKEGYGADLVLSLLDRYRVRPDGVILDTFSGSGTTLLTCQLAGRPARGVEFSPFFTFVGQAKLDWWRYRADRLRPIVDALLDYAGPGDDLPSLSTFERIFDAPTREALMRAKRFARTVPLDEEVDRAFLNLGLAAIVEKVSPARKDGKGLKFFRARKILTVREALRAQYDRMLADLDTLAPARVALGNDWLDQPPITLVNGDARDLQSAGLADESVAFTVYSPPYLNTFDYSEVYKVELWLFDHIHTAPEFRDYRSRALRSHVSTPIAWTTNLAFPLVDQICWYVGSRPLWNRHIPAMINGYFDDMYLVLREQFRVSEPGARVVCIVGNSSYAGLPIPTDSILARIGERVGFRPVEVLVARHLGTSAQQLADYDQVLRARFLRESAVVLEKPR